MPEVDPLEVAKLLDWRNPDPEQFVPVITELARAHTRGRGFDNVTGYPAADMAAVITLASARLAANPRQLLVRDKVGDVERELRSSFQGWTLAELAVLNRYRATAG